MQPVLNGNTSKTPCDDIHQAIQILGQDKVLTSTQMCEALHQPPVNLDTRKILYSLETLQACAEENRQSSDWRLVHPLALSFLDLTRIFGYDANTQPCFSEASEIDGIEEESWVTDLPTVGYQLIDFSERFENKDWQNQEQQIAELGPQYERADEVVVAQAVLVNFIVSGERLLDTDSHWGRREFTPYGGHVSVGLFEENGFLVDGQPDTDPLNWSTSVCVALKPEF